MNKLLIFLASIFVFYSSQTLSKQLEDYVAVLPQVLDQRLPIDPNKGYLVKKLKPDVYLLTDGIWQSVFTTTGNGVILIDAPQSFGKHIQKAVAEVTDEPISHLVYTHSHVDHIGGSIYLKQINNLTIVSSDTVARFLREKNDPRRLQPNKTFKDLYVFKQGNMEIEFKRKADYHSNEGDLFAYIPQHKVLVVIDSIAPGYAPFMDFDLSSNMYEYMKIFDEILEYDFDTFIGGHITHPGTRKDVVTTQNYVMDVYKTVKRIHNQADQMKIMSAAAKRIGWDNKYLLFKTFLENVISQCASEIESRWLDKLAGVDVWSESHCRSLLIYVRWDD